MSMTTKVVGIVPPDEEWKKMKEVWNACREAEVEIPDEVWEFFNEEDPDEEGQVINLPDAAWRECGEEMSRGIEVILDGVPENVKIVRFINSW